jgi:archaellum component FlaG (FlaF/FlaG flagellin family)
MRSKNILKVFLLSLSLLLICGCGYGERNSDNSGIHNEINGRFAYLDDSVYYLSNKNEFYESKGDAVTQIENDVIFIQDYNDAIYFIKRSTDIYTLYVYKDGSTQSICELPQGNNIMNMIYKDKLYSCIDNRIYCVDINTKEEESIPTDGAVFKFCIANDRLYYCTSEYIGEDSIDSLVYNYTNGIDSYCFYIKANYYDLTDNKTECIYEFKSNSANVGISVLNDDLVIYDPENEILYKYAGKLEKLYEGNVSSFIVYKEDILFYSLSDNKVYRLSTSNAKTESLYDSYYYLLGCSDKYIYTNAGLLEFSGS